jgi:hypothetical protein
MGRKELEPLWDACEADNADRIRELFQTSTLLKPEDAQDCLFTYIDDADERIGIGAIRALLDNGASMERGTCFPIGYGTFVPSRSSGSWQKMGMLCLKTWVT